MPLVVLRGERWDARRRCWVPLVLLTNLPLHAEGHRAGPYGFPELWELYRRRWEIEVFFKFVKQHLSLKHLISYHENGIEVMLHMTLIAAVLLIWYKHRTGITTGWRSVKFWMAEDTRQWTRPDLKQALAAPKAPT